MWSIFTVTLVSDFSTAAGNLSGPGALSFLTWLMASLVSFFPSWGIIYGEIYACYIDVRWVCQFVQMFCVVLFSLVPLLSNLRDWFTFSVFVRSLQFTISLLASFYHIVLPLLGDFCCSCQVFYIFPFINSNTVLHSIVCFCIFSKCLDFICFCSVVVDFCHYFPLFSLAQTVYR